MTYLDRSKAARAPLHGATGIIALAFLVSALLQSPAQADSTSTMLSGPADASVYGEPVDFSATVYGAAPSGMVTLMDDSKAVGTGSLAISLGSAVPIETGYNHTCAITGGGALNCWGANSFGQLGDGTVADHLLPVQVSGLTSGIAAVSGGQEHTCALTDAGAVMCWGHNSVGQLGNGTTTDSLVPVQVSGLASGAINVSAGYLHTCALTEEGAVKCWGDNSVGQLGDGTAINSAVPVQVSGLTSGVVAISR